MDGTVCMQECLSVLCLKSLYWFSKIISCYWQFKRGRWCVLLLWLSELWLLLLMLLLLIITKCWMLSFIVRACACVCFLFLFFKYFISCKRQKSFYTLPCCGQQAMGLLSTFYCASLRFLCRICFYTKGRNNFTVKLLLDIDWSI